MCTLRIFEALLPRGIQVCVNLSAGAYCSFERCRGKTCNPSEAVQAFYKAAPGNVPAQTAFSQSNG